MSRIFTGAKAVIKLDAFPLAWVSSITVNQEHRLEEIPELDNLELAEHAESGLRCSFTINKFKTVDETAFSLGIEPRSSYKDILTLPELIVEIFDDTTGLPVYSLEGVKFEGGSGTLDARGVWVGVWNFKAKRARGL